MPLQRATRAVVLAALALGALQVALAIPPEAPEPRLTVPQLGDRGTYSLWDPQQEAGDTPPRLLDFHWEPGPVTADAEGRRVPTDRLEVRGPDWRRTLFVERGTSRIVQQVEERSWHVWQPNEALPALSSDAYENRTTVTFPAAADCALVNPLQGGGLGDRLRFPAGCFGIETAPSFRFDGMELVDRWVARRYVHQGDAGDPPIALWFADGLPVPLQTRTEEDGVATVLRLSGFEAGETPRTPASAAVPRAKPAPLADAPARPWGPDDAGTDHPYPLSRAYTSAQASFPPLRAYLRLHPQAYMAAASYVEAQDALQSHRTWYAVLHAGAHAPEFCLVATWSQGPRGLSGQAFEQACVPGPDGSVVLVSGMPGIMGGPYGRPAQAPERLPTMEAVLERWAWHMPSGEPTGTAFSVLCADAACADVDVWVAATHAQASKPLPRWLPAHEAQWTFGALWLKDGVAVHGEMSDRGSSLRDRPDPAAPPEPVATAPAGWRLRMDLPGQAGAGLLAALLGLAYWAWPKVQALLPGSLFSRLAGDEVLAHPARRRLLALVRASPGIHHNRLRAEARLANGALAHHVASLVAQGHLAKVRVGGATCYFAGAVGPHDARQAAALRRPVARRLLDCARDGPVSVARAAAATGLPPATVRYHLHRLAEAGALQRSGQGRGLVFAIPGPFPASA